MRRKVTFWPATILLLLALLISGCGIIKISRIPEAPPAEIDAAPAPETEAQAQPTVEPTPGSESDQAGSTAANNQGERLARHGLFYALLLPVLILGLPWIIVEFFVVRYVQPRGVDVAEVRVKAQDGLFLELTVSMTARRSLTLASTRMTWGRVREFVEKSIEQELIHAASQYPALEDFERNLKSLSDSFIDLPIVGALSRDFGVEVHWFNIEIKYPQETMDALQQKAEAAAGGTAYLAFAAAAHLNPNTSECRELFKVYQQTAGQVDAARNLGGGITGLAEFFARRERQRGDGPEDATNVN